MIKCIDGVRTLSIMWVITGHMLGAFNSNSINGGDFFYKLQTNYMVTFVNATVSVDSFFLLGGLLTAYLATDAWAKAIKSGII